MTIEPFLKCKDLPASVAFYTEVLDFKLVVAPNPDSEHFESRYAALSREGSILHLSSHGTEEGVTVAEIYIRVADVDAVCVSYLANGVKLSVPVDGTAPVDQTWGMREIGFKDPDGNKITVGQELKS